MLTQIALVTKLFGHTTRVGPPIVQVNNDWQDRSRSFIYLIGRQTLILDFGWLLLGQNFEAPKADTVIDEIVNYYTS